MVEVWSAERLSQFRKAGFPRAASPPAISYPISRQSTGHGPPPRIVSPQTSLTYYIQASAPHESRLLLQANAAPGTAPNPLVRR